MTRGLGTLVLLAAAAGCSPRFDSRRAESVPDESLPLAADTVTTPFSGALEAGWLGGRTWLVVAGEHNAAVVVDFERRSLAPVGGPDNREIERPFNGFTIGDTAFIADWGKRRVTAWSADGRMVATIPPSQETRGILPKARDAAGQLYYEVPPIGGPDGRGTLDSIAIVRSDAALTRFDTVAHLAPLDVAVVQRNSGKRYERLVFSGADWWGVRPDGRLWIARVNQNQVNTIVAGLERKGERLPDPVLEVTRADRERFVNAFPEEVRTTVRDLPFSPYKPPFERAFPGGDGTVWLRKSRVITDSLRRYHVVDTAGMLARVFTTLGNGVIIAAGPATALMAEDFKDGIRLMEIRLPAPPPPPAAP